MRGRAADALGDKRTAMRHLEQAAANESAPFSTQLHFARVAFNGGWFGEAIDAYQMVLAHAGADQSARDEPSASSAGWPRAIRGAREILSAGDPKAAWKLLDRVAQSWPQMTEVDHESDASWPCCTPRRVVWNRPAPPNAWRWAALALQLVPDDPIGLRLAAVGAMRLHRFEQALPLHPAQRCQGGSKKPIEGRQHESAPDHRSQARRVRPSRGPGAAGEIVAASGRGQVAQDNLARAQALARDHMADSRSASCCYGCRKPRANEGLSEQWTTLLRECPDDLEIVRYCATRLVRNGMSRTRWPWSSAICPSPATIPPGCSPAPSC